MNEEGQEKIETQCEIFNVGTKQTKYEKKVNVNRDIHADAVMNIIIFPYPLMTLFWWKTGKTSMLNSQNVESAATV